MCFLHIWTHILLAQSIAAEVVAALDVDVEALGGRRDIVMPTLEKVRELLEGSTEAPPTPSSLRTIGRSKLAIRPSLQSEVHKPVPAITIECGCCWTEAPLTPSFSRSACFILRQDVLQFIPRRMRGSDEIADRNDSDGVRPAHHLWP